MTYPATKCSRDAYVAMDMWSHMKGLNIRERLRVAPIEEKIVQHRLRWFGHVQRRPEEAPVDNVII
ncbi:hypothetical protein EJB05_44311, partial [Eragrostis curvula]